MPFKDTDHQHRADDATKLKLVGRWAPDADTGHERRRALVLDSRHALAGPDVDAVTDADLNWCGALRFSTSLRAWLTARATADRRLLAFIVMELAREQMAREAKRQKPTKR